MHIKQMFIYSLLAVIAGTAFIYLIFQNISEKKADYPIRPDAPNPPEKLSVNLYFANRDRSFLTAEEAVFTCSDEPGILGSAIINALIQGSEKGLLRTIPEGTELRAFYISEQGIAYSDFTEAVTRNHPGGAESELMTIYSVVNSLILNIPEIRSVKILIGGKEALTLAGHIDLRFPFTADMLLIR
jgi:spore germination protein GerM